LQAFGRGDRRRTEKRVERAAEPSSLGGLVTQRVAAARAAEVTVVGPANTRLYPALLAVAISPLPSGNGRGV
jgi:hypothetical protein